MSKKGLRLSTKTMGVRTKNKGISCSTPENQQEHSPIQDSDSLCDSDTASPVPFLCTQDGADGETDVVWNYYTPHSDRKLSARHKSSTPLSRKSKKWTEPILNEKPLMKRKPLRDTQKKTQLFQDLLELNKNLYEFLDKKPVPDEEVIVESDEDIFNNSIDYSPKNITSNSSRCLRRNLLSSKFNKPEVETAMESDDSLNDCLIKASQIVEEKILNYLPSPPKKICMNLQINRSNYDNSIMPNFKMDNESMDAILNCINLESPVINKQKIVTPKMNDSFDAYVGTLDDSALERLTQAPVKTTPHKENKNINKLKTIAVSSNSSGWIVKELKVHECSPSVRNSFGRHSSMPESPSLNGHIKPSTSGTVLGRYNSLPHNDSSCADKNSAESPPMKCTQDEIKRKHQQAREKLFAKRQLPFTQSTQTQELNTEKQSATQQTKKNHFVLKFSNNDKVPMQRVRSMPEITGNIKSNNDNKSNMSDLKSLIEKKRQEALLKLRRKQSQNIIT